MANNIEAKLVDEQTNDEHSLTEGKYYLINNNNKISLLENEKAIRIKDRLDKLTGTNVSDLGVSDFYCMMWGEINSSNKKFEWYLVNFRSLIETEIESGGEVNKMPCGRRTMLSNGDRLILLKKYKFKFVLEK